MAGFVTVYAVILCALRNFISISSECHVSGIERSTGCSVIIQILIDIKGFFWC